MRRVLGATFALMLCCRAPAPEAGAESRPTASSSSDCLADHLGTLRHDPSGFPPCELEDAKCRKRCAGGSVDACLSLAYAAERTNEASEEARSYFRQACTFGSAPGCTNFGSRTWSEGGSGEDLECARRLFEKACGAGEPFGCGMEARMLLQRNEPGALEKARRKLEDDCARLRGFPCRVLAKHLEAGDFGSHDPGRISLLLEKACYGGDPDGCGRPRSAAATFH
jgi:TPR repeat protein